MTKTIYRTCTIEELYGSLQPASSLQTTQLASGTVAAPLANAMPEIATTIEPGELFTNNELLIICAAVVGLGMAGLWYIQREERRKKGRW